MTSLVYYTFSNTKNYIHMFYKELDNSYNRCTICLKGGDICNMKICDGCSNKPYDAQSTNDCKSDGYISKCAKCDPATYVTKDQDLDTVITEMMSIYNIPNTLYSLFRKIITEDTSILFERDILQAEKILQTEVIKILRVIFHCNIMFIPIKTIDKKLSDMFEKSTVSFNIPTKINDFKKQLQILTDKVRPIDLIKARELAKQYIDNNNNNNNNNSIVCLEAFITNVLWKNKLDLDIF